MIRLKIIRTFEGFHKELLDGLVSDDKTYVRKKTRFYNYDTTKYNELLNNLKTYDLSKFKYDQKSYGIFIYPDNDYKSLYKELCDFTDDSYNENLYFYITLRDNNLVDFDGGVPVVLQGTSLGYNLYKLIIDKNNYVTSNRHSSEEAYNLWYNLLQDDNLYAITSNTISVLIKKDIDDITLKGILDKIKQRELEFDDDLKLKIVKIYGSLEQFIA